MEEEPGVEEGVEEEPRGGGGTAGWRRNRGVEEEVEEEPRGSPPSAGGCLLTKRWLPSY